MSTPQELGSGYAGATPEAGPTVDAVLAAAGPGDRQARLIVVGGPPGVGKSTAVARLVGLLPGSMWIDKDLTAAGFVLQSARDRADPAPYGSAAYWQTLRPLEYAGPTAVACANLVGRRRVFLVGGWGPELAEPRLWDGLARAIAPAALSVIHLDAPSHEIWRQRLRHRGSRCDSPYFERLAQSATALPVFAGAQRVPTEASVDQVVQRLLDICAPAPAPTAKD